MNKTDKKAMKAGIWYTVADFLTKGAVFFTTPFFTRLMTTEQMGEYSNVTSWLQILVPIATFDMATTLNIARFDYQKDFKKYISSVLIYGSLITAILYLIVEINMEYFLRVFSMEESSVHIIFIYMMVYPALLLFQSKNKVEYRYKLSTSVTMVSLLLSIAVAILLTKTMKDKTFGRLLGHYGVYIVICLVIYIYTISAGKGFSFRYFKYSVSIAFPMIWHTLSLHLLSSGDRIVIRHLDGASSTALYSVAYTCAHVVSVLYHSINSAWAPWGLQQMKDGELEKLKKSGRIYVGGFFCLVLLCMLICPELLLIVGGKRYMEAKGVLAPAMMGVVCQMTYSLYVDTEYFLKKPGRIATGTMLAAGLNLILNWIFIQKFGYVAAAYTTYIGYFCLFLFHFFSVKSLGKISWFDTRFNFTVICLSLVCIPVANFLFAHNAIRYSLVGIVFVVGMIAAIRYRNESMRFIKKFLKKDAD